MDILLQDLDTEVRRLTASVEDYCEDLIEAINKGKQLLLPANTCLFVCKIKRVEQFAHLTDDHSVRL